VQAAALRGGPFGRADQHGQPGRIDEADLVQVGHQRAAAGGQLEQAAPAAGTAVAMSISPATVTTG